MLESGPEIVAEVCLSTVFRESDTACDIKDHRYQASASRGG